jgi:3-phosphoshikimate 1-carboxyvinyltransferase
MVVQGGAKFHAAAAASHGDHRLAMLGAVAALMTNGGESRILGAGDVAVSYPGFWDDLARLSGA